jgi:diketogulonate reductase-like aldo/keto reductase
MMTTSSRFGESVPVQTLADGHEIPTLALGVWQTPEGSQTKDAVRWSLELGYRHIDTAQGYGNEESVGEGFRQSGLDRSEVFITTKFYPGSEDPVREIEASLQRLRLEYVDLYLVHWPQRGPTWAWPGMEQARSLGYARSIGVSNFDVTELDQVFAVATSPPIANQINLNPFSYRRELIEENRRRNLVTEAYSPLGTGRHLSNSRVKEIADRVGRSPSQVLIRWGLQHDFVVLAKSSHRERIAENAGALRFSLSEADMAELDRLDAGSRPGAALEGKWW